MRVSVVEAWQVIYEGSVEEVRLPGEDGEVGVLDFHHPLLCRLRRGYIQLMRRRRRRGAADAPDDPAGDARILITDGVARMTGNELVILVHTPGERSTVQGMNVCALRSL